MAKIFKRVESCADCPGCRELDGQRACWVTDRLGAQAAVPADGSIPEWCPLEDVPAPATRAVMEVSHAVAP